MLGAKPRHDHGAGRRHADNFKVVDDPALATADAAWIRFDEGGPLELVLCDPTNLQTKKVADGPCTEDGDKYRCGYTVTLTNTGRDPFKGRIDVTDTFSTAPVDVTFPAGWDCSGAGANWTCSTRRSISPQGESVSLKVTAKFAKTSRCVVSNRATMIFPPANTRWNGSGADDSAVAFSPIPSPECNRTPKCEAPAEERARTVSERAPAPAQYARDPWAAAFRWWPRPSPNRRRRTGRLLARRTQRSADGIGQCVCKSGVRSGAQRTLRPEPGEPEPPIVIEPPVVEPPRACGPNECALRGTAAGAATASSRTRDGRCIPDKPDTCPPGMTGKPPNCKPRACGEGTTGKRPECRPITCPPGTTGRPPKCKPIDKPKCPSGQTGTWPNCRPVDKPKCPPGTTGTPPRSTKPIDRPKCPPGRKGGEGTTGKPPRCVKIVKPCPPAQFRNNTGQCVPRKVGRSSTSTPKLNVEQPVKRAQAAEVPDSAVRHSSAERPARTAGLLLLDGPQRGARRHSPSEVFGRHGLVGEASGLGLVEPAIALAFGQARAAPRAKSIST